MESQGCCHPLQRFGPLSSSHLHGCRNQDEVAILMNDRLNVDPLEIVNKALENVRPRLEVKSRRVGGATYQVPMEVTPARQVSLAMRWIVQYADGRRGMPMAEALAAELKDAASGQGNAIKKRDDTHKMAQANRAFAHFRW